MTVLPSFDLSGKFGGRAVPLLQPVVREHFARCRQWGMEGGGRQRDGCLELFSSIAAAGHKEARREQRGTICRRAGVGEKLDRPASAGFEDLAKCRECPDFAGGLRREHVIENEIWRSGGLSHCVKKISRYQHPAQTWMGARLPSAIGQNGGR